MTQKVSKSTIDFPKSESPANINPDLRKEAVCGCSHADGFSSEVMTKEFMDDFSQALECLENGGVILYPTDTVWGIGCDAECSEAVKRIFEIKHRSDSKAMLSLVASTKQLARYVGEAQAAKATELTEQALPRALTVVMENACGVAPQLIAADGTAAFRLTREPFTATLCRELGRPLVSTSANISGHPSPSLFKEIEEAIVANCDYVVKYRRDDEKACKPSRIVKLNSDGSITTLRE